jgi:hypothetical protein
MKKDDIDDTVVVLDYPDNWVEFFEQDGHPALRVLPPFAGKRLMMTEHYRHRMVDNLRASAPDLHSGGNAEWVVRLTIDALGVEVIPDA